MKRIKKAVVMLITIMLFFTQVVTVFAYGGSSTSPEMDGWKNRSDTSLNGTGVEYEGLRIGNTVWCKQGDVLGVTVWGKQRWTKENDWDNTIAHAYLSLGGTDSFSKYYIYDNSPKGSTNTNPGLNIDSSTPDVSPVDKEIGYTATGYNNYWHAGSLFWLRFNQNDRTYQPKANLYSYNGNWLSSESNVSGWATSGETIRTDSDAPTIRLSPSSKTSNTSINVGLNLNDSGCGMQKYQYSVSGASNYSSGWVYAASHSDLTNSAFQSRQYNTPEYLSSSTNSMSDTVSLNTPGSYQVTVTAVDNLGNTSTSTGSYTISSTPITTPSVTANYVDSDGNTLESSDNFTVGVTLNQPYTCSAKSITGYTVDSNTKSATPTSSDINPSVTFIYTQNAVDPPVPKNNPPIVNLNVPATVALGDDLNVPASGSDPDGDAVTYAWTEPSDMQGTLSDNGGTVYFMNKSDVGQTKTFTITATDSHGATATATGTTIITEPKPSVYIGLSGTLKENRKITLTDTADGGSKRFPIDAPKTQWSFTDSAGNPVNITNTADSGPIESLGATTGTSSMDMLFTKAGQYTAKCTVYNTLGDTATTTQVINIVADQNPIANYSYLSQTITRDPNNNDIATFKVTDSSSSTDDDNIDKRVWLYAFDSNNDGNFDNETWYIYTNGTWSVYGNYAAVKALGTNPTALDNLNSGNSTQVAFSSNHVGSYRCEEIVRESFGQSTIPSLITVKDCKIGTTY